MAIFNSYVSLPEGIICPTDLALLEALALSGRNGSRPQPMIFERKAAGFMLWIFLPNQKISEIRSRSAA